MLIETENMVCDFPCLLNFSSQSCLILLPRNSQISGSYFCYLYFFFIVHTKLSTYGHLLLFFVFYLVTSSLNSHTELK